MAISCFPFERKHRVIKNIILYVFKNVELAGAKDYVNHAMKQFLEGRFRFEEYWLDEPVDVTVGGQRFNVCWHAHTPIGEIHRDDLILASEGDHVVVGCVNRFFEKDGDFLVDLTCFQSERPRVWTDWITDAPQQACLPLTSFRAALKWARRNERLIRVIVPPALKLPE